jgi:hypothetical protein
LSFSERCRAWRKRAAAACAITVLAAAAGPSSVSSRAVTAEDYAAIFGEKYAEAERFLRKNEWITGELQLPRDETRIALAVVFPEIVRFNALEDDIQVRGLKVLYVQYGRAYANFSVGRFQMKPSFAEKLEADWGQLFSDSERRAVGLPVFERGDTPDVRGQRVRRLDDMTWQVRYLRLFMLVMGKRYPTAAAGGIDEQLRFYATAYNAGYLAGDAAIRGIMPRRRFHIALVLPATTYSYADVALFFFRSQAGRAAGAAIPGAS